MAFAWLSSGRPGRSEAGQGGECVMAYSKVTFPVGSGYLTPATELRGGMGRERVEVWTSWFQCLPMCADQFPRCHMEKANMVIMLFRLACIPGWYFAQGNQFSTCPLSFSSLTPIDAQALSQLQPLSTTCDTITAAERRETNPRAQTM